MEPIVSQAFVDVSLGQASSGEEATVTRVRVLRGATVGVSHGSADESGEGLSRQSERAALAVSHVSVSRLDSALEVTCLVSPLIIIILRVVWSALRQIAVIRRDHTTTRGRETDGGGSGRLMAVSTTVLTVASSAPA